MADEARDRRVPKHPSSSDQEDEDKTPVDMPMPALIARTDQRTKQISATGLDVHDRVVQLERGHHEMRSELVEVRRDLGELSTGVVVVNTKLDLLVEESKESRRERLEREKRAEMRAELELKFKRERALKIIGIIVPLVAALGTLFAGLAGAFR